MIEQTPTPPAEPRGRSWPGKAIDIATAIPGAYGTIWHRIRHPFSRPYTLIISREAKGAELAGEILKKGRIDAWGEMPADGVLLIMVEKRDAARACQVLARYGIQVLNPPQAVAGLGGLLNRLDGWAGF